MTHTGWRLPGAPLAARSLVAVILLATALASGAQAQVTGVALQVLVRIPPEVTVGQRAVPGRLQIDNGSSAETGPVRVTQIGYDPACRSLSLPCASPDIGVFVLAPTAIGSSGACAGQPFDVLGNAQTGRLTFVPRLAPVDLQPPGLANSGCSIDFTFDVERLPTSDTQPPPASMVTRAVASVSGQSGRGGATSMGTATITVRSAIAGAGRYNPLTPSRILDTRTGIGGIAAPVGPGATVNVAVAGQGGVPATGATAVAMNVTATSPTADGYLTIYPSGTVQPNAANLNFSPNKTVPNMVVVKLGTNGRVDMFNSAGSTHVIYDVAGWFSDDPTGNDGRFQPLTPARILDTRTGVGGSSVRLGPGASFDMQVTGQGGVPPAGAEAVVMNVAVTNTTATSFLTVHPTGEARPNAANLNWVAGDTVSNRVIAKLGANGRVTLYNNAGLTDIIVDTNGWFTDATQAGTTGVYVPLDPARTLDTRFGIGGIPGPRPAGSTVDVQVTGQGGVPLTGVSAVILNATVVSPAGAGFLTIFPGGTARPVASDLNYANGEVRPNLVIVKVGPAGTVSLYTSSTAHVIFDVAGWFT